MLISAEPGCLFSVGLVILLHTQTYTTPQLDLPRITGRDLQEVAWAKKSTAGGLDGWIKALPLPCFAGLAVLLELVEKLLVFGLRGYWMPILP